MNTKNNCIVLATNNKHKVKEIRQILRKGGLRVSLMTLDKFPHLKPVVENKKTIEGNAIKKAKEVAQKTKLPALSDDTGLFIRALKNRPGVYSARFAGPKCSFKDNNNKVLRLMTKIPWEKRTADFRCVAALAMPNGKVYLAKGNCLGKVIMEIKGGKGFGYDPIFYIPQYRKTFAELPLKIKNKISHRFKAFHQIPTIVRKAFR